MKKTQKEAFRMKGALWNAQRRKTTKYQQPLQGLKKAKEKTPKLSIQIGKKHSENHSEKNRALQYAKKNNKTTKKKGSHRRTPS